MMTMPIARAIIDGPRPIVNGDKRRDGEQDRAQNHQDHGTDHHVPPRTSSNWNRPPSTFHQTIASDRLGRTRQAIQLFLQGLLSNRPPHRLNVVTWRRRLVARPYFHALPKGKHNEGEQQHAAAQFEPPLNGTHRGASMKHLEPTVREHDADPGTGYEPSTT
jgi:hypothetical protein